MAHEIRNAQHPHTIPGRGWYSHEEYIKELSLAASILHVLHYDREYSGLFLFLLDVEMEHMKELGEKNCPLCIQAKFRFNVIEHHNGYELLDTQTGKTAWLGDGVDAVTLADGTVVSPGTTTFITHWEWQLNENPAEILEAYFPTQPKKED